MGNRRQFIGSALGGAIAALLPNVGIANSIPSTYPETIRPKRLKKGDTIGLIAPGYAIAPPILEEAKKTLKSMGFKPFHTNRIIGNYGYLSNTDEERAKDLNEMFANPDIDGILCARGGYGCTRIMQMIDYETIKKNGKTFIGFSDITALLNGIYQETGLVTFHGPVGSTLNDPYSIRQLEKVVMFPRAPLAIQNVELLNPELRTNPEFERYTITEGIATGKLVGGSLTLINALIGTPHEIDFTDTIVCIEDVEEAPYRIDRMLTQLIEGSTFKKAAGILIGVCAGCNASTNPKSFSLKEVMLDRIRPLGIPAVYGMSFGHVENNFTFPIGITGKMDAAKMNLQLLEKAVI
ncbi:LD-carboxypeptidase [Zobellia galactanivorans]|uniref:S66 peptidase family protein n=1 Tax=Zobellia galactanivorans (strain DSM 12802 / CCUG 47099 / CIP 106680 / NCIMB 13871 / Dsij) TaxID=63186 RepID=UPI0026E1C8BB|nr:LD-carboxypeptidase [Zobellia galactanivorans]MDO6810547.1 LD-carboxypeptidase [Zobellia galactanivorans]